MIRVAEIFVGVVCINADSVVQLVLLERANFYSGLL